MGIFGDWWGRIVAKQPQQPIVTSHEIDYQGAKLSIKVHDTIGFTESELTTFKNAMEVLIHVVNSEDFKQKCLNPPHVLDHTKGMSNQEIYDLFMSGKETTEAGPADGAMDLYVTIYYSPGRVIGYTYPNNPRTWVNRRFYGDQSTIVGNAIHETCHRQGFEHEMSGYTRYNVPYYYGDIGSYYAKLMIDGTALCPLGENQATSGGPTSGIVTA